jgi:Tfp pilus assembly protein PilO
MAKKITFALDENIKILVVSISIFLVAIVMSYNIYKLAAGKVKGLYKDISDEKEKLSLRKSIAGIDDLKKKYDKYFYKNAEVLEDTISSTAKATGADVISIGEAVQKKIGSYIKVSCRVVLNCSYNKLGKFIEKLEKLPNLTKIEELTINSRAGSVDNLEEETVSGEGEVKTEVSILISGYALKF